MPRALLIPAVFAICFCARVAQAQDDSPPAPSAAEEEEAPAAPESDEAIGTSRASRPPAAPSANEPAAEPSTKPAAIPAEPRPQHRYEGQIGTEGGPTYEDEGGDAPNGEDSAGGGGSDFEMPGFSIRIDPFNWLLEGRLGLELEVVVWKFISIELVPVFVSSTEPPSFNFSGRDDPISQHSNGLGPIAGVSIGAGFWLTGTPLRGYVLRAGLTDYNYTYEASDSLGVFDRVSHADRRFIASIGSYSRFGFFTIGGDLGLGYELNQGQRCVVNAGTTQVAAATSGCPDEDELQIMADRDGNSIADLNGVFHPIYIVASFSLGVSFD